MMARGWTWQARHDDMLGTQVEPSLLPYTSVCHKQTPSFAAAQIAKTATMAVGMTPDEVNEENLGDPSWWAKVLISGIKGE